MNDRLIVIFEKSQEDIPVLCIARESMFYIPGSPSIKVENMITGDKAIRLWNELKGEVNDEA